MIMGVRERTLDALARYGERALMVLKLALKIADSNTGPKIFGEFDYKSLVRAIRELGVDYNPSPLLRSLEREYAIIETTYHSSTRHWWRFVDREAVREALAIYEHGSPLYEEPKDPRVKALKAQVAALEPERLLAVLRELSAKERLSEGDKRVYRVIVFNELELAVELLEKIVDGGYDRLLPKEAEMLAEIVDLSYKVAEKLAGTPAERPARARLLRVAARREPLNTSFY